MNGSGKCIVIALIDSVRLRLARGIAPELAGAADDYEYLCTRLVDVGRRVTDLQQANARLGEAAFEMQQERDAAQAELENIRARGYGSLYAEELETLGHRPWMHDNSNPRGCWCHRN